MYSLLTEPVARLSLVRFGLLTQARPLKGDAVPDALFSSRGGIAHPLRRCFDYIILLSVAYARAGP